MTKSHLIEVEFTGKRRAYFRNPDETPYQSGTYVMVETETGYRIGLVRRQVQAEFYGENEKIRSVLRPADDSEIKEYYDMQEKQESAAEICVEQIQKRNLNMKLIDVDFQLDGSKITFFFTAERRVDFRDLVKALAGIFKTRIELRQVGVRDEAKRLDGIGPCGKRLCCSSFLQDFSPITLKMARDQHISLTPSKISGVCGRLLCCLEYEHQLYKARSNLFPAIGSKIQTNDGQKLTVTSIDIFKDLIVGQNAEGVEVRIHLDDMKNDSEKSGNTQRS